MALFSVREKKPKKIAVSKAKKLKGNLLTI